MPSETLTLAFDTSAAHCAAALLLGDRVLAAKGEAMARGQAERLVPMLQEVLKDGGCDWPQLTRLGVGIGPGNFTGIRISVALARGLSLGLGIPAIGVSGFDVIRQMVPKAAHPAILAPREQVYLDQPQPFQTNLATAPAPLTFAPDAPDQMAVAMARVAAAKDPGTAPTPLYIRPADAAPARDVAPLLIDDA